MDFMNVNSALSATSRVSNPASLQGAVSIKMLDNSMDMTKQMSEGMVKMMENSVTPHLGSNIDVSV